MDIHLSIGVKKFIVLDPSKSESQLLVPTPQWLTTPSHSENVCPTNSNKEAAGDIL